MTDETLILNFLNQNYKVKCVKANFLILDELNDKSYTTDEFIKYFLMIFGDFNIDEVGPNYRLFLSWFVNQKDEIIKKIVKVIKTLDINNGSKSTLIELINICIGDYDNDLLTNIFFEFYKETYFRDKLDNYISNFNGDLGSVTLFEEFKNELDKEHPNIINFANEYMNNWYSETIIGEKIKDFLSQLVITLGSKNWVITWVGHGQISKNTLLKNFKNENEFQQEFILNMYDKWYDEAIMEASERVMRNPLYGSMISID